MVLERAEKEAGMGAADEARGAHGLAVWNVAGGCVGKDVSRVTRDLHRIARKGRSSQIVRTDAPRKWVGTEIGSSWDQ